MPNFFTTTLALFLRFWALVLQGVSYIHFPLWRSQFSDDFTPRPFPFYSPDIDLERGRDFDAGVSRASLSATLQDPDISRDAVETTVRAVSTASETVTAAPDTMPHRSEKTVDVESDISDVCANISVTSISGLPLWSTTNLPSVPRLYPLWTKTPLKGPRSSASKRRARNAGLHSSTTFNPIRLRRANRVKAASRMRSQKTLQSLLEKDTMPDIKFNCIFTVGYCRVEDARDAGDFTEAAAESEQHDHDLTRTVKPFETGNENEDQDTTDDAVSDHSSRPTSAAPLKPPGLAFEADIGAISFLDSEWEDLLKQLEDVAAQVVLLPVPADVYSGLSSVYAEETLAAEGSVCESGLE